MKLRLTLSITAALTLCSIQASDWRIHPTFDGEINYMVDTPSFTYFTGKVLPDNNFFPTSHSLFRYDKEGEELQSLSTINLLSDNTVSLIGYCSGGGYLRQWGCGQYPGLPSCLIVIFKDGQLNIILLNRRYDISCYGFRLCCD